MNSTNEAQSHNRKTLEPSKGAWKDGALDGLLEIHAISDQQLGEFTRSKLQDLDMRIQRSQNFPASGDAKARWRVWISTCVSINLDHKHENRVVGTSIQEQVDIQHIYQAGKTHSMIR